MVNQISTMFMSYIFRERILIITTALLLLSVGRIHILKDVLEEECKKATIAYGCVTFSAKVCEFSTFTFGLLSSYPKKLLSK